MSVPFWFLCFWEHEELFLWNYTPGMKAATSTEAEKIPEGSARSKHYPDWKIRKCKCMRNENAWGSRPKLSNEKIKFLICNLLGEESSLLCYGNKRLLHGSCFLIRAWADEGLPEASWLQCREWSVSRGWSEAWCWPKMQWLYYYDMCRVTWGCHQWRFQLFLLYPELQLLGQLVFRAS